MHGLDIRGGIIAFCIEAKVSVRKATKGSRLEQTIWNPFLGRVTSLVRLAAMFKAECFTEEEVNGMWGDHNRGVGGWDRLDIDQVQLVPEGL